MSSPSAAAGYSPKVPPRLSYFRVSQSKLGGNPTGSSIGRWFRNARIWDLELKSSGLRLKV